MCAKKEITELLARHRDRGDSKELIEAVYEELHRIAKAQFAKQPAGHTLQPTALVHDAYAKMFGGNAEGWENRRHFYAAAAEVMRHILVDQARRKKAQKRGGDGAQFQLEEFDLEAPGQSDEVLQLHDALERLSEVDPEAAELVKLRYFVRLTIKEAAATIGTSVRTANRLWDFARRWLAREIGQIE